MEIGGRMNYQHLEYFLKAAEYQHYTRAAEHLHHTACSYKGHTWH